MSPVCPEAANCGFLAWLEKIGREPDCGKIIEECGRLNPNHPVAVTEPGPAIHEETKMAREILGYPPRPKQ